jgi:hypothetical protein
MSFDPHSVVDGAPFVARLRMLLTASADQGAPLALRMPRASSTRATPRNVVTLTSPNEPLLSPRNWKNAEPSTTLKDRPFLPFVGFTFARVVSGVQLQLARAPRSRLFRGAGRLMGADTAISRFAEIAVHAQYLETFLVAVFG